MEREKDDRMRERERWPGGERWVEMGRHKDRDTEGAAENKGDRWNKMEQNGKETEKKQERQRK